MSTIKNNYDELFLDHEFATEFSIITTEKFLNTKDIFDETKLSLLLSETRNSIKEEITKKRKYLYILNIVLITLSIFLQLIKIHWAVSFSLAVILVFAGIALSIMLFSEIISAAGTIHTKQFKIQTGYKRKFNYKYSISSIYKLMNILFISFLSIFLGYAFIFSSLSTYNSKYFSETLYGFNSMYFSIVTFATVGYGDIVPKLGIARFIVSTEIITAFLFISIFLTTTISWVIGTEKSKVEAYLKKEEDKILRTEMIMKAAKLGEYGNMDDLVKEVQERINTKKNLNKNSD
ncbi:MAG: hypothetical protein JWN78_2821 [Bacteroidota bacterium]|nr:hypothetical protein [Bacteroidota bacterium]